MQGLWHLLPCSSPPGQVKVLQEGKTHKGDGHWGLLLVKYSTVMMETVIWWGFFLVVWEQHELGVFSYPLS